MCLSVPAKVISVEGSSAKVLYGSAVMSVSTALLEEVKINDYVLVHTGFAIQKLSIEDADEMLKMLREILGNET